MFRARHSISSSAATTSTATTLCTFTFQARPPVSSSIAIQAASQSWQWIVPAHIPIIIINGQGSPPPQPPLVCMQHKFTTKWGDKCFPIFPIHPSNYPPQKTSNYSISRILSFATLPPPPSPPTHYHYQGTLLERPFLLASIITVNWQTINSETVSFVARVSHLLLVVFVVCWLFVQPRLIASIYIVASFIFLSSLPNPSHISMWSLAHSLSSHIESPNIPSHPMQHSSSPSFLSWLL